MKGIILQQGIINKYGLEAAYVAAVLGQILVAKKEMTMKWSIISIGYLAK